ncbi:MAG: hypothetical protein OXC40_01400 [Proteobacteria bacterium]|nr:hypothetical protein [Pseudomonadota bacterium]
MIKTKNLRHLSIRWLWVGMQTKGNYFMIGCLVGLSNKYPNQIRRFLQDLLNAAMRQLESNSLLLKDNESYFLTCVAFSFGISYSMDMCHIDLR